MSQLDLLLGLLKYLIAVAYVLVILGAVGYSVVSLSGIRRHMSRVDCLLLSPAVGFGLLSAVLVFFAHHEVAISLQLVWGVVAMVVMAGLFQTAPDIAHSIALLRHQPLRATRLFRNLIAVGGVGLLPYVFLFLKRGFPTGLGTSVTWTNNDLGAYIEMATNVAVSGVADAGLITGWNAGLQASFDHPAAHPLFASIARILFRQPYQVGIVLMATVVATIFAASLVVIRRFTHGRMPLTLSIPSLVIVLNPPILAAIANFFFPQLVSIGLAIAFFAIGLALASTDDLMSRTNGISLVILFSAIYFISVEIAVILLSLSVVFIAFNCGTRRTYVAIKRSFAFSIPLLAFVIFLEIDLFRSQFEILTKMNSSGVAGWKSNFVSLSMLVGLTPTEFGGPYGAGSRLLDLCLASVVVFGIVQLARKRRLHLPSILSLGVLMTCGGLGVLRWGIDGYQTWKFITTIAPFLFLFLVVISWFAEKDSTVKNLFVVLSVVASISLMWSAQIWKETTRISYVNEDLIQISRMETTKDQTALNVLLAPFFETMAASVMTGVPTHLASPTYFFFEGQDLLYRCTLTTKDKVGEIPDPGPIAAQHGNYVLVGTPLCD